MFVLANLVRALAHVLDWLLWILQIAVILRVILSWVNADPYNPIVRVVGAVTEPLVGPFRRLLPPWRLHGWDLSPLFALLALWFIQMFLIRTLFDLAARMG
jgi:YggT family protein